MKKQIFNTYDPKHDITYIFEDTLDGEGNPVSTELKGFYFGEPCEEGNKTFYGDLKAEF